MSPPVLHFSAKLSHTEMQKENSSSDAVTTTTTRSSTNTSPHLSRNPFLSPSYQGQFDPTDITSFYPSTLPSNINYFSISPSDSSFDDTSNTIATENRLNQASFILEYQQLYNCYTLCLASLQESLKDVEALHQENDDLRLANTDLVQRLSLLSQATIQNCLLSSGHPSLSFVNDFNRLSIGGSPIRDRHVAEETSSISPTSVIENNRFEKRNVEKVSLPKSISVRSSGYLKMNQRGGSNGGPTRATSRNRVTSPSRSASQRVYVPGGKKEAEALEFDVYNQGMLKTELCNKWQETGACPYGENCQFAHGIAELRPVIRHPRYKTEVCRMVLAGDICPYGHRCHFRHSLTDQERLIAQR